MLTRIGIALASFFALSLVGLGCASSADPADEEDVGAASEAIFVTYYGYCQVGANGLLTGQCASHSTCATAAAIPCTPGAQPGALGSVTTVCGTRFSVDTSRACSFQR